MLLIETKYLQAVNNAGDLSELSVYLQKAIELEHATIPPYLTAMISLKPGSNDEIRKLIHSVVIEEMLHMSIAANILNAIGGHPVINQPGFIPVYPGPLPMNSSSGFIVPLERFSKAGVKNIFMEIEEPEDPILFQEKLRRYDLTTASYATIGEFYRAIQQKIGALADNILPGHPARQMVTSLFSRNQLFPILTRQQAINAIDIIIEQGEGTTSSPLGTGNDLAHYYRFEEIYKGKRLVKDPAQPNGYIYGPPIPFDETAVFPISANTHLQDLPCNTAEEKELKRMAYTFSYSYTKLLNGLHNAFNGDPGFIAHTMGLMYDIKLIGQQLAATPFPGRPGETVGPPFEYVNIYEESCRV